MAALQMQLDGVRGKLADVEERLTRMIDLWEKGAHVPSVVERMNNLEVEKQTLNVRCASITRDYEIQKEVMETAESKQRSIIELMNVIHDKDVRLKIKQHLGGLINYIDVDLPAEEFIVIYTGQVPVKSRMVHADGQSTVMEDYEW